MKVDLSKLKDLILKIKRPKEGFSFGIDIGTATVKMVKLKFHADQVELCAFDLKPSLKEISPSINDSQVNISVSGPSTVMRYVNLPRMKSEELKQSLRFEAQKYIPFPIAEVNLDSWILNEHASNNEMLVLLAAAKKDCVSQRVKLAQDAGLKVSSLDIDSAALLNAFIYNYQPGSEKLKTVGLLNIGAGTSNLNILEDNTPRLSRDICIAGAHFTQKIVDSLVVDLKAAEGLKLNPGKDKLDRINLSVKGVLSSLAGEIRTSFDYYESRSGAAVEKIFLSGGGSLFGGLKDMLAELLGVGVEYWDPLSKITVAGSFDPDKIKAQSSQLAVAVGLALRR
ncbi:type IV pilus assembly protein PilM [Candidatus Omnitrophota bacterium]